MDPEIVEPKKRKLLIAIGNMNSGKSAFVKMLVCERGSRILPAGIEIKIGGGVSSVTN